MNKIIFGKPVSTKGMEGENNRVSECGRYRIERRRMASARNGYWNAISYLLVSVSLGGRIIGCYDYLADAIEAVN